MVSFEGEGVFGGRETLLVKGENQIWQGLLGCIGLTCEDGKLGCGGCDGVIILVDISWSFCRGKLGRKCKIGIALWSELWLSGRFVCLRYTRNKVRFLF